MTLLAGWAAVLSRLSGQDDVVVGTPTANRGRREIEGLIGFFVNTLALRVDLSGSPTVAELLERVKARALARSSTRTSPSSRWWSWWSRRAAWRTPRSSRRCSPGRTRRGGAWSSPGLEASPVAAGSFARARQVRPVALLRRRGGGSRGVEYATALFERATVERWLGYLRRVLEEMAAGEAPAVDRLPLLPEAERRRVVEEWNATDAAYPADVVHPRALRGAGGAHAGRGGRGVRGERRSPTRS
jgi:non-ribosomal peptide synthetase component F